MFKELLSLPVTLTIQTRVYRRQIILLCWTHVPCDVIIKRRTIPMRLSRNFFQGGGVLARRPENSLDNVFCLFVFFSPQLILQFTEGIQWFYYTEN